MSNTTIPKTREEDYASSIFEWVKADREGEVCKFKEFANIGGEEYVIFNDNSRIKSNLIGDVVLKHQHESQLLGREIAPISNVTEDEPYEFPIISELKPIAKKTNFIQDAISTSSEKSSSQVTHDHIKESPVMAILEKSKKKKQKVVLEIQMEMPSAEVLNIIRDNFSGSDDELYLYFIEKIDKKKFVSAVVSAVQNK